MVAEGVTVVVSTSYLDEAERCDRVVMMSGGRGLALDTPRALQASLEGTMLALRTSDARSARALLRSSAAVRTATLFGDTVHALLPPGTDPRVAIEAVESGNVAVDDVATVEPSLEDVFIHLVAGAEAADGHA